MLGLNVCLKYIYFDSPCFCIRICHVHVTLLFNINVCTKHTLANVLNGH